MLASYYDIRKSEVFPLENISGIINPRKKRFPAENRILKSIDKTRKERVTPIFSINDKDYVPAYFSSSAIYNKFSFDNFDEYVNTVNKFSELSLKHHANPIMIDILPSELVDGVDCVYGLIPWIEGTSLNSGFQDFMAYTKRLFNFMNKAAEELGLYNLVNMDLNSGNMIYTGKRVKIIDPSLAVEHFRPKGDYLGNVNDNPHIAPEIAFGGSITQKTTVYALGNNFEQIIMNTDRWFLGDNYKQSDVWKKYGSIVEACQETNPNNRPTYNEIRNELNKL